jgi:hypothetical protein
MNLGLERRSELNSPFAICLGTRWRHQLMTTERIARPSPRRIVFGAWHTVPMVHHGVIICYSACYGEILQEVTGCVITLFPLAMVKKSFEFWNVSICIHEGMEDKNMVSSFAILPATMRFCRKSQVASSLYFPLLWSKNHWIFKTFWSSFTRAWKRKTWCHHGVIICYSPCYSAISTFVVAL